jgi:recombination protein RecA
MGELRLEELINQVNEINRKFGQKVIGTGSEYSIPARVPTGSLSLDHALGGGWPAGRFVMLWGNRSSGKSTLCLRSIAEAQRAGMRRCLYIDAEKGYDATWAEKNGVDTESLLVMRKNNLDDILSATKDLLQNNMVDVVALDSINAINSPKFFEEENNSIGQNARAVGELLSKWNAWNQDALIILISQARNKFAGTMVFADHGGGLAAEHFPSVIVKLFSGKDKTSFLYEKKNVGGRVIEVKIGQMIKWEITKSKVSNPFLSGQFPLYVDGRRDDSIELIDLALKCGVIEKAGSWFKIGDEKFHGENDLRKFIQENQSVSEDIKKKVFDVEVPQEED